MKKIFHATIACLAMSLSVSAQNSSNNESSQGTSSIKDEILSRLTPEEKARLKSAHDQAIQQDPSLETNMKSAILAMQIASKAMHDAMIKKDPEVAPLLEKIAPGKWKHLAGVSLEGMGRLKGGAVGNPTPECTNPLQATMPLKRLVKSGGGLSGTLGFASLTPQEQAQLKSLHEKVQNDPSVVAAKEAEKNASTPADRFKAREVVRKAIRDAMIREDSSIETILKKIRPSDSTDSETQDPIN